MGCDIHLVLETRHKDKWIGVHSFDPCWGDDLNKFPSYAIITERNYAFFGALANVRSSGPSPRGIPTDISDLADKRITDYGEDGHSHTWYTLDEIAGLLVKYCLSPHEKINFTKQALQNGECDHIIGQLVNLWLGEEDELSDYRLIIWFDN